MISVNHQFDITGNAIALEVIVPDNARSFSKPLMLVAQQGSRTSSYFSHISYETLKGEGFDILNESGIRKVAGALNLHYMIPLESLLFTTDGSLRIVVLNGFHNACAVFEALAHFTIQPFAKRASFTMSQHHDMLQHQQKLFKKLPTDLVVLPTRFRKPRKDFVAFHQPLVLPDDFILLDFDDPEADDIVFLPRREMKSVVEMDIN